MAGKNKPVTDAYLVTLRSAHWPNGNPFHVGDHRAPDPPTGKQLPSLPYVALYCLDAPPWGGTMDDPHADARHAFQLIAVGANRGSAQAMSDAAWDVTFGRLVGAYTHAILPVGRVVVGREELMRGRASREGEWWNAVDQYVLLSVPTT